MELNLDHKELIEKVAKENGFQHFEYDIEPGSNKGDNFLGIIKRVTIKDDINKLSLILKIAQTSEILRKIQPTRSYFLREIYIYEKIFEEYSSFEEQNNITKKFRAHASLYGKCDKDGSESLLLEDMKNINYLMGNRKTIMNSEHIKCVLKEYAKFHSIALVMGHKEPERFRKISKYLEEDVNALDSKEREKDTFELTNAVLGNAFKAVEGDSVATEALKKYSTYLIPDVIKTVNPEENIVITHGDGWCNNLLFKYEKGNREKPSKVCILDWQLSKLGSPCIDIGILLFTNASKELLDDYKFYLNFYYDAVSENIKQFSCLPDEILSYETLEKQFHKYSKYTLWVSIMLLRIMLCEPEESPDLEKDLSNGKSLEQIVNFSFSDVDEYHRRIAILVNFMVTNDLF